ncbi:hypothetical protein, partial [Sphaerimonospora thailandensis]|uniref:hypothetical protein n=1 Tax=Sphaerimonospora thailandensis TaxID=795644 RepID=UPI00194E9F44
MGMATSIVRVRMAARVWASARPAARVGESVRRELAAGMASARVRQPESRLRGLSLGRLSRRRLGRKGLGRKGLGRL